MNLTLEQVIKFARATDLKNFAVINNYDELIQILNLVLIELHARFTLKQDIMTIPLSADQTTYKLTDYLKEEEVTQAELDTIVQNTLSVINPKLEAMDTEIKGAIEDMNTGLNDLADVVNKFTQKTTEKLDIFDGKFDEMNAKITELDTKIEAANTKIEEINTNIGTINSTISEIQTDLATKSYIKEYVNGVQFKMGDIFVYIEYETEDPDASKPVPLNIEVDTGVVKSRTLCIALVDFVASGVFADDAANYKVITA
jgi:translation elongation factor EF-G